MAACFHATASPNGDVIAFVRDRNVYLTSVDSQASIIEQTLGIDHAQVKALKFSASGLRLLAIAENTVKVFVAQNLAEIVSLDNGSRGLGKISNADFIGDLEILVAWEFGKAKIWSLASGKSMDLSDVKVTGRVSPWKIRPDRTGNSTSVLAFLSKNGATDQLCRYVPSLSQHVSSTPLQTTDVQSLSWSPDGSWLSVLDVPTAAPTVHIYTPEGHLYRTYPPTSSETGALSIQDMVWSPDNKLLAVTYFNGKVELLNTRTFSPLTVVQHDITIDQRPLHPARQALVWQETVAPTNQRTYTALSQPVSAPLTRTKPTTEPGELGVAELCFSCDGSYMASRDSRMLNTVWIWSITTFSAHAVVIQHSPVRRMLWHPSRPGTLMIDCAEGMAYVFEPSSAEPPRAIPTSSPPKARLSWLRTPVRACPAILVSAKSAYEVLRTEENAQGNGDRQSHPNPHLGLGADEDDVEDSLFDVLSGRKPMHPKTQPSYTEMVDLDVNGGDSFDHGLDDTFQEKRKPMATSAEIDPLDDSQIF